MSRPTSSAQSRERIVLLLLLATALVGPHVIYPLFLVRVLALALFASAYNLVFGYAGMLGFGHAAFFGLASYTVAQSSLVLPITPEIALLFGVAVSALFGGLCGWLAIRRQGLYFAMITLALSQLVFFYFAQADWAKGEDGIQSVPRGAFLGLIDLSDNLRQYYFVLFMFLIGFAVLYRTINSPFGEVLKAVRDNEDRATSLGYSTSHVKLMAFTISAAVSGLAGGLVALSFQLASLSDLHYMLSAEVILMVLIGGAGTMLGPVVGAAVVVAMQSYFAPLGAWVLVAQGVVFVIFVLTMRSGIVGAAESLADRINMHRGNNHLRDNTRVGAED